MDPHSPNQSFDPVASQWKLLLVLGVAGLIASLSLNLYLLKHNKRLTLQRTQQNTQLQEIQQKETALNSLLQDVVNFSAQYPEVRGILSKYGISVNPPPSAPFIPLPPSPPSKK